MKLSRADVEWLLATHENGRGPVDWGGEGQRMPKGLDLRGADLRQVKLNELPLAGIHGGLIWSRGNPETAEQREAAAMHLEGADLSRADPRSANLRFAHLEGADLYWTHLERADLRRALLNGTKLENITLSDEKHIGPRLADVRWGDANLTVVKWSQVNKPGDEYEALKKTRDGKAKDKSVQLEEYEGAVRANRQLAIALQDQGLNEDAARFAYRAQILQRKLLWEQRNFWIWFGSMMLALLAGYGYRMGRILVAYLIIVLLCSVAYFVLGMYYGPHLSFLEAVLISISAFHGRVFSGPFLRPGEPQLWVTAFEAVAGLVIEGVFIAMLIPKLFGK